MEARAARVSPPTETRQALSPPALAAPRWLEQVSHRAWRARHDLARADAGDVMEAAAPPDA